MFSPIYIAQCTRCKEITATEICGDCLNRLHQEGEQNNAKKNESILCDLCIEMVNHSLCEDCGHSLPEVVIFDIEPYNHLQKDCNGDVSKLKLGLAGLKSLDGSKYFFFEENDVTALKRMLYNVKMIIGYNLVGHNGLDYEILKNYKVKVDLLVPKTYDLMTLLIRTFGSYKNMHLDNFAMNTFGLKKKKNKKANYKLIQNGQLNKVKENLKHELTIIEKLFKRIEVGGVIRFQTPAGLIDEHEVCDSNGFSPKYGEETSEPYDFPLGGMRLQIKNKYDFPVKCKKCRKNWRIRSK